MSLDTYIARQPIFDRETQVYAYELFFRSGLENFFQPGSQGQAERATSQVIVDSTLLLGMENITSGRKAFINLSRDMLLGGYATLLPKERTVLEILETVEPEPGIIAACQDLKQRGYLLALDDFVYDDRFEPLVALADIIKVDVLACDIDVQSELLQRYAHRRIRFLAEKVETWEDYRQAREMGYEYFQGYFFSKPDIIQGKDIPGFKVNLMQVLKEIQKPELNFSQLEQVVKREVSLSYKLLRHINSAYFGLRNEVESIRHALVLLGEKRIKKLTTLIVLANLGEDQPEELVVLSCVRARFLEELAPRLNQSDRGEELFLLGLFSAIDSILSRPLVEIIPELPLGEDLQSALLERKGLLGDALSFCVASERGSWEELSELGGRLGLDLEEVTPLHTKVVQQVIDELAPAFQGAI